MKKLVAKKDAQCMACLQCVTACSEAFYKQADVTLSCIQIVAKGPVPSPTPAFSAASVCAPASMRPSPRIPRPACT